MAWPRISKENAARLGHCGAQGALAALSGDTFDSNPYWRKGDPPFAVAAWDGGYRLGKRWVARQVKQCIREALDVEA
jgi:hypothetical protein